jgi:hypothetical protein
MKHLPTSHLLLTALLLVGSFSCSSTKQAFERTQPNQAEVMRAEKAVTKFHSQMNKVMIGKIEE